MCALRLATLVLTVRDPRESSRFYRWCLDLEPDADAAVGDAVALSWGHEDRVLLVPAEPEGEESFALRMPARPMEGVAAWLGELGLTAERVVVPAGAEEAARVGWPDDRVVGAPDEASANRVQIRVRAPGGLPVELEFPLPEDELVEHGSRPFRWRSRDWSGLEIPGLLGVRTGAPEPAALRSFAAALGAKPMAGEAEGPLSVGDHQWIVEPRDRPGIYGFAVVVPAARLAALERTLAHFDVEHRLDGNRLLAADPGGRIVLIQGVRGG